MKKGKKTHKTAETDPRNIVTFNEATRLLGTTRSTLYRWMKNGTISAMKAGRQWRFRREDIERFLAGKPPRFDLPADIKPLIKLLEAKIADAGAAPHREKNAAPLRRAVCDMILFALSENATDIHISSHVNVGGKPKAGILRTRVNGVLHVAAEIDSRLISPIVEEWMRLAGCRPDRKEAPQDGLILFSESPDREAVDIRCSFVPTGMGPSVTARIIDSKRAVFDFERLGFADGDVKNIEDAIRLPWGLIVFTGFTGCGKTTTVYSCLGKIAKPGVKTLSAEDPVEVLMPWVVQISIDPKIGLTFPEATIMMLRSDPDTMFIGEIRDEYGLRLALGAAVTGHVVMTVMHASSAAGALRRMVDIGIEPFLIADASKLVVAQRLIRSLCPECSKKTTPPAKHNERAKKAAEKGGLDWEKLPRDFRKAVGCKSCRNTGYCRRTVVAETLKITPEIAQALRSGAAAEELERLAVAGGMTTIAADAVRRAACGETTCEEIASLLD